MRGRLFRRLTRVETEALSDMAGAVALAVLLIAILSMGGQ